MKLYQILTEKKLNKFLIINGLGSLTDKPLVELKKPYFGDYIVAGKYKFKKIYNHYQCMETPKEKHEPTTIATAKNPNDSLKWK